jgi:hypothetical protein
MFVFDVGTLRHKYCYNSLQYLVVSEFSTDVVHASCTTGSTAVMISTGVGTYASRDNS